MNFYDIVSSGSLKHQDINGETLATATGIHTETVKDDSGKEEIACFCTLAEFNRPLRLNKTNGELFVEHFGGDTETNNWDAGLKSQPVKLILFVVDTGPQYGLGIRIRKATEQDMAQQPAQQQVAGGSILSQFTPDQIAAMSPEQIAALTKT